jgi:hypothetical protein
MNPKAAATGRPDGSNIDECAGSHSRMWQFRQKAASEYRREDIKTHYRNAM